MSRHLDVRPGAYHDSVTLMQVSSAAATEEGVGSAMVAMATDLNLGLLDGMGFDPPSGAGPNDLLVAVQADDDDALARALARVEGALAQRHQAGDATGFGAAAPPHTIGSAARRGDATVAFVSTPGLHAFVEAMDALEHGLPVIVFSDNVSLEQELRLKTEASRRGLLVMGPDCGTAVIGGVGFGFANVVRPGPIGLVAASGTGAQHLMTLVDAAGVGISHCLGVGGRDLSSAIGGLSTLAALDLLAEDDTTELIVVVSKPPADDVADVVRERATHIGKPVVFALLGEGRPDLTMSARTIAAAAGAEWCEPRSWPSNQPRSDHRGHIKGLFAGGTLCDEAMLIVGASQEPVLSNIPLRPDWALPSEARDGTSVQGHVMIDFGDDRLTRGRPHPMIDNSLRIDRMICCAEDTDCAVLLLDVVLGHGSHPDPAAELAPAIARARNRAGARGRDLAVVVSLVGTADDPQGLERQAKSLREAGASIYVSNAEAARQALELTGGGG